jgi:hypothetical protein
MEQVLVKDPYHGLTLKALVEAYKGDPSQAARVREYRSRLERLAKSKPAPARPVSQGNR